MQDTAALQGYVNNFKRYLSRYLRPGIGVSCNVYPAIAPGAIIEFVFSQTTPSADNILPSVDKVSTALSGITQHAFGGNLAGFVFSGTNIISEDNKLIIIKGDDNPSSWGEEGAHADVMRLAPAITVSGAG